MVIYWNSFGIGIGIGVSITCEVVDSGIDYIWLEMGTEWTCVITSDRKVRRYDHIHDNEIRLESRLSVSSTDCRGLILLIPRVVGLRWPWLAAGPLPWSVGVGVMLTGPWVGGVRVFDLGWDLDFGPRILSPIGVWVRVYGHAWTLAPRWSSWRQKPEKKEKQNKKK